MFFTAPYRNALQSLANHLQQLLHKVLRAGCKTSKTNRTKMDTIINARSPYFKKYDSL